MEISLKNKSALVTGASRGIGAAIAEALSACGANVMVAYKSRAEDAERVAASCRGGDSATVAMEVSSRDDVERAVDAVTKRWGRFDILVNNAGYLKQTPFADISDAEWAVTMDANLRGVFLCSQVAGAVFASQNAAEGGGGCIVNITSVGGQMGGTKAPHYAAAKAGVISLTKSTAKLLAPHGVRVNAIAPGFIKTDMYEHIIANTDVSEILASIPLGRVGLPGDVADAAAFLASDRASYITGHVLNVNGGMYLGAGS
ncbi:MAG: 3-oxoacyl-ACP reductase FabG [Alphaproteobacteria bacterium]|nr:3-oxoacyl-ACP reductase FabG [Alphaproteobacteria bacterium]MBF0249286.1 3-oxoacyl-ACP reductase FabG [Alphaproteobacteria bacterium]